MSLTWDRIRAALKFFWPNNVVDEWNEVATDRGELGSLRDRLNEAEAANLALTRQALFRVDEAAARDLEHRLTATQLELAQRLLRDREAQLVEMAAPLTDIRKILDPYCEDGWTQYMSHKPMKAQLDWEEEHLFNESDLRGALSTADAWGVLIVWRRFREVAELVRKVTDEAGYDRKKVWRV